MLHFLVRREERVLVRQAAFPLVPGVFAVAAAVHPVSNQLNTPAKKNILCIFLTFNQSEGKCPTLMDFWKPPCDSIPSTFNILGRGMPQRNIICVGQKNFSVIARAPYVVAAVENLETQQRCEGHQLVRYCKDGEN